MLSLFLCPFVNPTLVRFNAVSVENPTPIFSMHATSSDIL